MAIIKFGVLVAGARGTASGLIFTANGTGPFVRAWSKGSNPRSALQSQVRGRLSRCGPLWAGLSGAQKAAWDAFGAAPPETDYNSLGEVILLSGWQWLVRVNQRRQSVGLATTTTVPTNSPATQPASCTLTLNDLPTGPCSVAWTGGDFPANTSAVLFAAIHPTQGLQTKTADFRQVWAEQTPAGASKTLTSEFSARFGDIQTGWTGYARLYQLRDDGVRSIVQPATTVVI